MSTVDLLFGQNFQFVLKLKQNVMFYSSIAVIESKARPIAFNNNKEIMKTIQKETKFESLVKNEY
jgi:hypothetical protein